MKLALLRRTRKFVNLLPIVAKEVALRTTGSAYSVALVITPSGQGSLGDQAMIQTIEDHLGLMGMRGLRQVLMPGWHRFPLHGPQVIPLATDVEDFTEKAPRLDAAIRSAGCAVAIGADVIDGRYGLALVRFQTGLLTRAAHLGIPAALLGHSVSDTPVADAMTMIAELPKSVAIYVRDPVSFDRFVKHTGRTPILTADLAFLLKPDTKTAEYAATRAWVERRRQAGDLVLCLNVNGSTAESQAAAIGAKEYWRRFLVRLWSVFPPLSVMLISHDTRPKASDTVQHEKIASVLPAEQADRVRIIKDQVTAARAKAICAQADFAVTGRMHLAIGAVSQTIPTFCMAYAGKFEGLAQHLQVTDFCIPDSCQSNPEESADWVAAKISSLPQRKLALQAVLPGLLDLARKNFSFLRENLHQTQKRSLL